jgi:hypothetical protein
MLYLYYSTSCLTVQPGDGLDATKVDGGVFINKSRKQQLRLTAFVVVVAAVVFAEVQNKMQQGEHNYV